MGPHLHPHDHARSPVVAGGALALLSAVAFGLATPVVQRFGREVGTFSTASILYAGAAAASLLLLGGTPEDTRIGRGQLPRILWVALLGAAIAPVCLVWGLKRTSGTAASLMLNSEAIFTVLFGSIVFREALESRAVIAAAFIVCGSLILGMSAGTASGAAGWGALAIVVACVAWAMDNVLTRPLAEFDPGQVIFLKGALGATVSFVLARIAGESFPALLPAVAIGLSGAIGYGASLRFYLLAQRRIGVARTGSIFALAPFIGAVTAWLLGERTPGVATLVAGLLFAAGVFLHLTERHRHLHAHQPIDHEHAHRHDDDHHVHSHGHEGEGERSHTDDEFPSAGEHSHRHRHEALTHEHAHMPDIHHRHRHD